MQAVADVFSLHELAVEDALAEQLHHEVLRSGPLNLQGRHVGLLDRDVEVGIGVLQPAREQQRIARRQGEPERVLVHAREHGIVDDAAVAIDDQHVLRLAHSAFRQIARRQELSEREPVGTRDLEAPLHGDVPDRDVVEQGDELRLERVEADREVHVVVNGEALGTVFLGRLVVRGPPVARSALHQPHVERLGHRGSLLVVGQHRTLRNRLGPGT